MGTPRLLLVPSPLLGPAVWRPVATALTDRGRAVTVPPPYGRVTTPEDVLEHLRRAMPAGGPVVVVLHSNAGLYAAALARQHEVRGLVFVDAGLPSNAPVTPTAPPQLRAFLDELADQEGLLPGWTHWWPADEVAELFPDRAARDAVEAEQARLPLTYFEATVPSPSGWTDLPAGYLAFGGTYAEEAAAAEARGWPVERLPGGHLHPVADPDAVVGALERLLGRMGL